MSEVLKMSDEEYFGQDYSSYISKSRLWKFANDPVGFFTKDTDYDDNKEHLVKGSALHAKLLEGETEYHARYTLTDFKNPKTGKPYGRNTKAFLDHCHELGVAAPFVITEEMDAEIDRMCAVVKSHNRGGKLLREYTSQVEVVLRGEFEGNKAQGKVDGMSPEHSLIVDLKTCRDIPSFVDNYYNYGYDWQAIIYSDLFQQVYGYEPEFVFIAVSGGEEPQCITMEAQAFHKQAREDYLRHVARVYRKCVEEKDYRLALFELKDHVL